MPQLGQGEKIALHYFRLKGAVGVSTICLEEGGIDYSATAYSKEEWEAFKPKTPNGQLPVFEYPDGTMLSESGAMAHVAAAQADLLGEGRDFAKSEMLLGMTTDLWKLVAGNVPTIMTSATFPPEKKAAWWKEFRPRVIASLERYPKLLTESGDAFTGLGKTLGELDLWYRLSQLVSGPMPNLFSASETLARLKPFYDRVAALKGPSAWTGNTTKFGEMPHYFAPIAPPAGAAA